MILANGTLAQADFATELLSPTRFPFTAIMMRSQSQSSDSISQHFLKHA